MTLRRNFAAGPGALPQEVLAGAQRAVEELPGTGVSILGLGHRTPQFRALLDEAEDRLRRLLALPEDVHVLFLQGGATMQFSMVPMTMLARGGVGDYVASGYWSRKAIETARHHGEVRVAWDGAVNGFTELPREGESLAGDGAAYLHYVSNETVEGLQHRWLPSTRAPLICDMSSDLLSKPLDVSPFSLVYAHAQKNLGAAGVTIVLVRDEVVARSRAARLPPLLGYDGHVDARSVLHTPPVFAIYVVLLMLRWLMDEVGGLEEMGRRNREKARLVRDALAACGGFYRNDVGPEFASDMNVTFRAPSPELDARFVARAEAAGLVGTEGHRSRGGLRISLYNGVTVEDARAVAAFLRELAEEATRHERPRPSPATEPRAPLFPHARPFTYAGGSAQSLVTSILERSGGRLVAGDEWDLYWSDGNCPAATYHKLDGKRRVSNHHSLGWLCSKHGLARSLERARILAGRRVAHDLFDFAPRSFVFPGGFQAWRVRAEMEPETIWIAKEGLGARGEGVNVVTDVGAVRPVKDLVLQEYIAAPHLIDGHKYTLRVYVAITSLDPLRVWVYPDGLTKLTTRPFTLDRASLGDRSVHLTNRAALGKEEGVDLASKFMTHARYRERLKREGHDDARLFQAIHALVAKMTLAARELILGAHVAAGLPANGAFSLLGLDVLVDREMRPWLIEANMGPSLDVKSTGAGETGEADVKRGVTADLLAILGLCPDAPSGYIAVLPSLAMFEWLPVYEELRPSDVADLRDICARRGIDPRVEVDPTVTVERDTPEELVVIHERHDHRIELNSTGALVWRCLARGQSVAETIRAVAEKDGAESAAADVWQALATFAQLGAWTVRL